MDIKETNQITCKNSDEVMQIKKSECTKRTVSRIQSLCASMRYARSGDLNLEAKELTMALQQSDDEVRDLLQSFSGDDSLKAMLGAQMLMVHEMQQSEYLLASKTSGERKQNHINSFIKLSNVFTQQTTLMQKLQGKGQQKVQVEHVHVNSGGQAIVGNVEVGEGQRDKTIKN